MKLEIVLPPVASSDRDLDLVNLTEYLVKNGHDDGSGGGCGLGGEFGYGVDFENDTFMMHVFCWCEKDDCEWCFMNDNSKQGEAMRQILLDKYGDKEWAKGGMAPNFYYKPTGLMARWYKWIGRDTEWNKKISDKEWRVIYQKCLKSI